MKCYIHLDDGHQEVDAAGVCTICGRGVCQTHSVMIGGKLYCKADADKQFGAPVSVTAPKPIPERPQRGAAISVASVLFYIFGILGIIGSLFIVAGGAAAGIVSSSIPVFGIFGAGIISLGFVFLIVSALEIVAGNWLWKAKRSGAKLGLVLAILSILVSIPFLLIPFTAAFGFLSILPSLIIVALIAVGWNNLLP